MLRLPASLRFLTIATLVASAPAAAIAQDPQGAQTLVNAADGLAPGRFIWTSTPSPDGPIRVLVSIPRQLAYVYRGAALIGASTVSTGKRGHETPTGSFPILQKQVFHRSNKYDDAPMPYMQRLTWDGVAMHAGRLPGYPASHGCVRLPATFAKQLYGLTRLGGTVTISDDDGAPDAASPEDATIVAPAADGTVIAASVPAPTP